MSLVARLGGLLAALILLAPGPASATGLGGFVSPGDLHESHAEFDRITACTKCHEPGAGVTPARCLACHDDIRAQVDAGSGFHARLGDRCVDCHPDHKGRNAAIIRLDEERFNHQQTGFALRGVHAEIACNECHEQEGTFTGLSQDCASCHEEPHGAERSERDLLKSCRSCHDADDWARLPNLPKVFDHDDPKQADFALHGAHAEVGCRDCHEGAKFVPTPFAACTDCHSDPHRGQFAPRTCVDCHREDATSFALRRYDHDRTRFPLVGEHRAAACESCHGDGRAAEYVNLRFARCDDCHADHHEGAFQPRDCGSCHSLQGPGFALAGFDHDATSYPLRRAHAEVACADCHGEAPDEDWTPPAEDCSACHQDAHEGRFGGATCASCHLDGTWEVDEFDHAETRFPLTGRHAEAECASCHGEGERHRLTGLPFGSCLDCHADDEPHGRILAAETCDDCHETGGWELVRYDHATATGFALDGAHARASCTDCHEDHDYRGEETACESCHDRPQGHFEGGCGTCHATGAWRPATLGATGHDVTGFPLRGTHAVIDCADCHAEREPASAAPTGCAACHAADDPHRNLLGDQCDDCHKATDWLVTTFRHALTGFPLRGGHVGAACEDCHATHFAGTPSDCGVCHLGERPSDGVHRDPLTAQCGACHRPYDWDDARSPHGGID